MNSVHGRYNEWVEIIVHSIQDVKRKAATVFFAFSLFCPCFSAWVEAQEAVNPLRGDLAAHDPVMIKSGSTFFLFSTGNGVSAKTSSDRIQWKNSVSAFPSPPAWTKLEVPKSGNSLWAPDIHFRNGMYWLYYSVSSFGSNVSAIGLATATNLNATGRADWIDQGVVIRSDSTDNFNAIDPNVIVDSAGAPWLVFGSFWSGIKLVSLDSATGKPLPDAKLYSLANRSAGLEAPFLFRRGSYWYLFVSWDKCCQGANSTYNIRVGRSQNITGPYLDSKGVNMTQGGGDLVDAGDARWKGPGHNAIFLDRDTVFIVNHAYDAKANGAATLWIRPLFWTPQGWPTLNSTLSSIATVMTAKKSQTHPRGRWPQDLLGRDLILPRWAKKPNLR